jgi:hypothetical protein
MNARKSEDIRTIEDAEAGNDMRSRRGGARPSRLHARLHGPAAFRRPSPFALTVGRPCSRVCVLVCGASSALEGGADGHDSTAIRARFGRRGGRDGVVPGGYTEERKSAVQRVGRCGRRRGSVHKAAGVRDRVRRLRLGDRRVPRRLSLPRRVHHAGRMPLTRGQKVVLGSVSGSS